MDKSGNAQLDSEQDNSDCLLAEFTILYPNLQKIIMKLKKFEYNTAVDAYSDIQIEINRIREELSNDSLNEVLRKIVRIIKCKFEFMKICNNINENFVLAINNKTSMTPLYINLLIKMMTSTEKEIEKHKTFFNLISNDNCGVQQQNLYRQTYKFLNFDLDKNHDKNDNELSIFDQILKQVQDMDIYKNYALHNTPENRQIVQNTIFNLFKQRRNKLLQFGINNNNSKSNNYGNDNNDFTTKISLTHTLTLLTSTFDYNIHFNALYYEPASLISNIVSFIPYFNETFMQFYNMYRTLLAFVLAAKHEEYQTTRFDILERDKSIYDLMKQGRLQLMKWKSHMLQIFDHLLNYLYIFNSSLNKYNFNNIKQHNDSGNSVNLFDNVSIYTTNKDAKVTNVKQQDFSIKNNIDADLYKRSTIKRRNQNRLMKFSNKIKYYNNFIELYTTNINFTLDQFKRYQILIFIDLNKKKFRKSFPAKSLFIPTKHFKYNMALKIYDKIDDLLNKSDKPSTIDFKNNTNENDIIDNIISVNIIPNINNDNSDDGEEWKMKKDSVNNNKDSIESKKNNFNDYDKRGRDMENDNKRNDRFYDDNDIDGKGYIKRKRKATISAAQSSTDIEMKNSTTEITKTSMKRKITDDGSKTAIDLGNTLVAKRFISTLPSSSTQEMFITSSSTSTQEMFKDYVANQIYNNDVLPLNSTTQNIIKPNNLSNDIDKTYNKERDANWYSIMFPGDLDGFERLFSNLRYYVMINEFSIPYINSLLNYYRTILPDNIAYFIKKLEDLQETNTIENIEQSFGLYACTFYCLEKRLNLIYSLCFSSEIIGNFEDTAERLKNILEKTTAAYIVYIQFYDLIESDYKKCIFEDECQLLTIKIDKSILDDHKNEFSKKFKDFQALSPSIVLSQTKKFHTQLQSNQVESSLTNKLRIEIGEFTNNCGANLAEIVIKKLESTI